MIGVHPQDLLVNQRVVSCIWYINPRNCTHKSSLSDVYNQLSLENLKLLGISDTMGIDDFFKEDVRDMSEEFLKRKAVELGYEEPECLYPECLRFSRMQYVDLLLKVVV